VDKGQDSPFLTVVPGIGDAADAGVGQGPFPLEADTTRPIRLDAGSRRAANAARNMAFLSRWLPWRLRASPAREMPDWRVTGAREA
jgi:hypothetical protein